jgi:hypothetical protein
MSVIRPLSNVASLATATNVWGATSVYVVNTATTDRTVTIANTVSVQNGGGNYGSDPLVGTAQAEVYVNSGTSVIINKKATDTLDGGNADIKGTKIALMQG